jgi:hypothetical protein
MTGPASVNLFWLPLGAGGRSVRLNGQLFEAVIARHERRATRNLYHSALEVCLGARRFVVEMAPAWTSTPHERGVVGGGPVGSKWCGRSALFRYEVRCWQDGVIADVHEAVESPVLMSESEPRARTLLDLVSAVPDLTWGRDERRVGQMWNSNSVTSWLLTSSGHDLRAVVPPSQGRAPGWGAGVAVAEQVTFTARMEDLRL